MQTKPAPYLRVLLTASVLAVVSVVLATASAQAATLSGKIFEGKALTTWTTATSSVPAVDTGSPAFDINGVFIPVLHTTDLDAAKPEYAGAYRSTAISNLNEVAGAKVMVRDFKTGAFVADGVVTGNGWTATVTNGGSYVVMFSAPGYDMTSRQFDNVTADTVQYAYLMKLNAGNLLKPGNLLVEAFSDNKVNGAPDGPNIDPPLNGVTITLHNDKGVLFATGVTGSQALPVVLENQMAITDMAGMYYFRDLPPGTYTVSANAPVHGASYLTTSIEGGPSWDVPVGAGDLGITIMPQAPLPEPLVWFGFADKKGAFPSASTNTFATVEGIETGKPLAEVSGTFEFSVAGIAAPAVYVNSQTTVDRLVADINLLNAGLTASTIPGGQKTGIKLTANLSGQQIVIIKNDTIAVFQQTVAVGVGGGTISGKCTDADFMPELNRPGNPFIVIVGENHPGLSQNAQRINNCFVIASLAGNNGGVVATTEGDANGNWSFTNVPVGNYELVGNTHDLYYIWQPANVAIQFAGEFIPLVDIWLPKFSSIVHGTVRDSATGLGIANATVHHRYLNGTSKRDSTTTTDVNGKYSIAGLAEIETLAQVDVEPPRGYRGALRTETFDPDSPSAINGFIDLFNPVSGYCYNCKPPIDVTFNASHRYVLTTTLKYQSDFYLEPVAAGNGNISGVAFNDTLQVGTWLGDGVYDINTDAVVEGATVNLYAQTGVDALGAPVYATTPMASTATGVFNEAPLALQGRSDYIGPYSQWQPLAELPGLIPLDMFGGVYVGPITPGSGPMIPGFYEFRDLAPGNYKVEVVPALGFNLVPSTQFVTVGSVGPGTAAVADNTVVANLGLNSSAPLPGELDGGMWDDFNLDQNAHSKNYQEKRAIVGSPVGVYDQFGYRLGSGVMGNPLCWSNVGSIPATEIPFGSPTCPGVVDITNPLDPALNQPIRVEGHFAPGVRQYLGNDPCLAGGFNNTTNLFEPLVLPYQLGQGGNGYVYEWAILPFLAVDAGIAQITPTCRGEGVLPITAPLPPAPLPPPPPPPVIPVHGDKMRVTGITGASLIKEGTKWYATALVTVSEVYTNGAAANILVSGARISATWVPFNKNVSCTTTATGQCTFRSEVVEKGWPSVTLNITGVTHTNLAIPPYDPVASATNIKTIVINKP